MEIAEGAVYVDSGPGRGRDRKCALRAHLLLWVQNHVVVRAGRMPPTTATPDERGGIASPVFTRKRYRLQSKSFRYNNEEDT